MGHRSTNTPTVLRIELLPPHAVLLFADPPFQNGPLRGLRGVFLSDLAGADSPFPSPTAKSQSSVVLCMKHERSKSLKSLRPTPTHLEGFLIAVDEEQSVLGCVGVQRFGNTGLLQSFALASLTAKASAPNLILEVSANVTVCGPRLCR